MTVAWLLITPLWVGLLVNACRDRNRDNYGPWLHPDDDQDGEP